MEATLALPQAPAAVNPQSVPAADLLKDAAFFSLDATARLTGALEGAVDGAAGAINTVVPAAVRFAGGLLVPEAANRLMAAGAAAVTRVATWLGAGSAKAALHAATFGVPAWSQAFRVGLAAADGTHSLSGDDNSREFLARCFAESTAPRLIKESLLQYLSLRKQLEALRSQPDADGGLAQLARRLAELEVRLREYQDFRDLKLILEAGPQFVEQQQKRINDLALATADRVLGRVQNFYKERCGALAGTVAGAWEAAPAEHQKEQQRAELRDRIALRLQRVFQSELTSQETAAEIAGVSGDLHAAFGTYRAGFKAAMATALGAAYATGALQTALEAAWSAASSAVSDAAAYVLDSAPSAYTRLCQWAADAAQWAMHRVSDAAADTVRSAASRTAEGVADGVANVVDTVGGWLDTVPTFDGAYWNGSSRVVVGWDAAGQPIFGESCISGLPATPRIESMRIEGGLERLLEKAPAALDLTEGVSAKPLSPEDLEALRAWVTAHQ